MIRRLLLCLLVFVVDHGQSLQIGEANMHFDSNSTSVGILTLLQRDANHPVRIVGTMRGFAANTVHVSRRGSMVSSEEQILRRYRDFTFTEIHSQTECSIARPQDLISIRTVRSSSIVIHPLSFRSSQMCHTVHQRAISVRDMSAISAMSPPISMV